MDARDGAAASRPTVAVLAGGRGRRIGGEKALAELAGEPLVRYPLAAAAAAGLDAFVVAKRDSRLPPLGDTTIVTEPDRPRHPLCGVLAALRHAGGPVLALGCDMPFVSAPLLTFICEFGEPALARVAGRLQPLPALYLPEHAPALQVAMTRGDSLTATLSALGSRTLGEPELAPFGDPRRLFFGINDAADLRAAGAQLEAR
jgi:molybdopterin-guanine dinucleotide biosynthesis protein A